MRTIMRKAALCMSMTVFMLLAVVTRIYSLDYPHNQTNAVGCGNCHWSHMSSAPAWLTQSITSDDTINNNRCRQCHDGSIPGVFAAVTHSALSTGSSKWDSSWSTECVDCHNPHSQSQHRRWGAEAYLATGTVLSVGEYDSEDDETEIYLSEALGSEYEGYYIIPNTLYGTYSYKISESTLGESEIYIKGQVNMTYAGSNKPFAIVYAKNVNSYISYKNPGEVTLISNPKLFDRAGFGDDSDDHTTTVRICEVCHTATSYHRFDTTGQTEKTHHNGEYCLNCHTHANGFAHGGSGGGAGCIQCHGHDAGTLYDPDMTLPYNAGSSSSQGRGTFRSHSTHTESKISGAAGNDDRKGPGIYCADCHDITRFPLFNDGRSLATTTVCDPCHSESGSYRGVSDPVIGAKANWTNGVYELDGVTLKAGKEKWCAGCHDSGTSSIEGVNAPDVIGDEGGAYTYGTGWGFYKTGHGLPAEDTYPAGGGITAGAGALCSDCHDLSAAHTDGNIRTYDDHESSSTDPSEYRIAYRLKQIGGQEPMIIPKTGTTDPANYRLCASCHTNTSAFTDPASTETNFRDTTNRHYYHLDATSLRFKADWGGDDYAGQAYTSRITCITCHNVHGSTRLAMLRDGKLISREPGIQIWYYNSGISTNAAPPFPEDLPLSASTGMIWLPGSAGNVCWSCHGGTTPEIFGPRTPYQDTAQAPVLDWTGENGYASDGAAPDSAPSGSAFTFRVKYTDTNNDTPSVIEVWIDADNNGSYESTYAMTAISDADNTYLNGKIYTKTVVLNNIGSSIVRYRFYAKDSTDRVADGPATGDSSVSLTGLSINRAPSLDWVAGACRFEGVSPLAQVSGTVFDFSVKYTDPDNNAPAIAQVWVDRNDDGDYDDDGEKQNMTTEGGDGDYSNGEIFVKGLELNFAGDGRFSYRFAFSDGTSPAAGDPAADHKVTVVDAASLPKTVCASGCDYTNIQAAVNAISSGQTVMVSAGTYPERVTFDGNDSNKTVRSVCGPEDTIIDASGATTYGVEVTGSTGSVMDGFSIEGGTIGVYLHHSSTATGLTLENCKVHDNSGGGIYCGDTSSITVSNSEIYSNTAGTGAGIYLMEGINYINDTVVRSNHATMNGGGVATGLWNNTTFTGTVLRDNTADGSGGGFAQTSDSSTAVFYRSTISGNVATTGSGGGLYIQGESGSYGVSMYNSLVVDNEADSGGGIWQDGNLTAVNCTIAGNTATGAAGGGGAIYANTGGSVTVRNSILWNNIAPAVGSRHIAYLSSTTSTVISDSILNNDGNATFNRYPYIVVQDGGSLPTISGFVSGSDPLFEDAEGGDYHIKSNSPAIDNANDAYAPEDDIDDDTRPQGNAGDIGADEYRSLTGDYAPVLAWTGEPDYVIDGVHPDSGENNSGFTFRVHYSDSGSGVPEVIQLWLDINDDDIYETGEKYDMVSAGGGIYTATIASMAVAGDGYLNYRFYASDGFNDATGGPTVNSTVIVTAPFVTFTSEAQSTAGETGTATITLQLNRTGSSDITVPFSIGSSSTAGGTDYSITPSPAVIPAGSTTANITLTITPDTDVEGDETVVVVMGAPVNALKGNITAHTVTITDDDAATLTVCSTNPPPYDRIQTTIADAATDNGDTIVVCPGTYPEKIDFLGKKITLRSQSGAAVTFITGDNTNNPVVTFSAGETSESILDGFTIDNQAAANILTRGISISNASSPLIRNCVVEGNVMSGGQNGAGININGGTATIQNSTIGGNASNRNSCQTGCGIYATALSGTFSIINSTISENTGTGNGAGIYLTANGAQTIDINNTAFANNTATLSGGAIYNNGSVVSISNSSSFTSNSAGVNQSGGAILSTGAAFALTVDSTSFASNSSGNLGGAIYVTGSTAAAPLSVSNSTFTNNTATQSGGAISLATLTNLTTISSSSLSGNSTTSNKGGAIYISGAPMTMTGTNATNNTAGLEGGGIYATGATSVLSITGGSVSGNSATTGGGFFLTGSATLTASDITISSNTARSQQGGGIYSSTFLTLANGTLENNVAATNGGGIYANAGISITGSSFTGNQGSTGGAVFNQGAVGNFYGANTFTGNIATGSGGTAGGAIFSNARVINVNDAGSVFTGNYGTGSGGAVYVSAALNINGATRFDSNGSSAVTSGGAVISQGGTINDTTFINNRAAGSGGAIYFVSTAGTVNRSTFSGNYLTAASNGGAFYSNVTGNNFNNCTFYNNSAGPGGTGSGGAIYQSTGGANINYCTFYDNKAATAPAIRFNSATAVKNSIVANPSGSLTLCSNASDGGSNLQYNGTCAAGFVTADPMLSGLADNGGPTQTMALQAGSAAIDTGTTGTCLATDQRGAPRPVNGGISLSCDKGAYEYGGIVP